MQSKCIKLGKPPIKGSSILKRLSKHKQTSTKG
jgi:hypothetical protein